MPGGGRGCRRHVANSREYGNASQNEADQEAFACGHLHLRSALFSHEQELSPKTVVPRIGIAAHATYTHKRPETLCVLGA